VSGIDRAPTKYLEDAAAFIQASASDHINSTILDGEDGITHSMIAMIPAILIAAVLFVLFAN
ncbi:MAG: methyl-accepting chemotaxis protein, partial [Gammaproteobacteria bacterium]